MSPRFPAIFVLIAALLAGCASGTGPRPKVPLSALMTSDDYPARAIRNEEQGTTIVRVDVSPEGVATGCWVLRSSGSDTLDQAACRMIQRRARFHPALDRKGRAVAGSIKNRVIWRLSEEPPRTPPPPPPQRPPRRPR